MSDIVLGGGGFIGSHLVDHLASLGRQVVVVDDFSRGHRSNLMDALATGLVSVHRHDLREGGILHSDGVLRPGRDVIWHLAAKVTGIEYNRHHHYDMAATNLALNLAVMEAVRQARPKLYVYVSTACVYPHDAPVPTPETAGKIGNPEPTNWGYGVAKWVGEQLATALYQEHRIPTLIVRFFNALGPRDYYDEATSHVAPALIRRVLEGENPVTVWGSGKQTRALVDARDIAKALVMLADCPGAHDARPVNIGHEREVSIGELAQTIIDLCDTDATLEFDRSKPDGYPRRAADTTRLRKLIGWVPDTPLDDTLCDMVQEFETGEAHL